jgi:acyl carrier protein
LVDSDLRKKLTAIFSDIFQVEEGPGIAALSRKDFDQWDSVNHLRLVMELEQVFEITLGDEEVTEINSFGDLEALLVKRVGSTDQQ